MSKRVHLAIGVLLVVCATASVYLAIARQVAVEDALAGLIHQWQAEGLVDGAVLAAAYGVDAANVPGHASQQYFDVDFMGAFALLLQLLIGGVVGAVGAAHLLVARRKGVKKVA